MLRFLFGTIFGIFLVVITGSIILDTFPQLQPLWNEFTKMISSLYQTSLVKYGSVVTALIIIGIIVMFGTSSGKGAKH